ncbi:MAG: V-type ATP synthase subunit F, partial [Firmicutes bacterium]|nr:V-type ATP synthase subunit F [Bacillota bacterium]
MYKIGVIGDRESILGFKAVGLDVFPIDDPEEAKKTLKRIAKEDFA